MHKNDFIRNNSGLTDKAILNTTKLLDEGATVPFIARYRKEMTSGLDEVQIAMIRDLGKKFDDLCSRQNSILSTIEEQGKLNDDLASKYLNFVNIFY